MLHDSSNLYNSNKIAMKRGVTCEGVDSSKECKNSRTDMLKSATFHLTFMLTQALFISKNDKF